MLIAIYQGQFALWHRYFTATYERYLKEQCGYKGAQPYWDWSIDASSTDHSSMAVFNADLLDSNFRFGGFGPYVNVFLDESPFNLIGRMGGGCVQDGRFREGQFFLNVKQRKGKSDCLRRDFIPWIMNYFGCYSLVEHVLSQPDYTTFARALKNIPNFSQPNIHGSGHFGIGGVLGTLANSALSPGDPLFYLHNCNLDRVFWEWQSNDIHRRLHQVGGPVVPLDYNGANVTLDFEINFGKLALNATLKKLLNPQDEVLCYVYHGL